MPTSNSPREPLTIGQWVRRILIGGVLLLVLLFAGARWNLRQQVNAEIDRIRAAGQPVTLVELDEQFRDLGGRPDGSDALLRALAKVIEVSEGLDTNGIPNTELTTEELPFIGQGATLLPDEEMSPKLREALAHAFVELGPALDDLGNVINQADHAFRHPIDLTRGVAMLLPHLSPLKQIAAWNTLRSAYELDRGNTDVAIEAVIDTLRLSRTLEPEPTLISQLVRLAMVRISVGNLERLLAFHHLTREQAENLRSELHAAQTDKTIHIAMLGERCTGFDVMHIEAAIYFATYNDTLTFPKPAIRVLALAYRMSGLADRDVAFYLRSMSAAVTAGTNSIRERVALANDGKTFDPSAHGKLYLFSSLLLPALEKAFVKEADCLTAIAAADAALAVEAWRAANAGRIPDSLADLVPEFFPEAPVDPATEKPLSIVPAATGYAIHGSGPLFTVRR